MVRLVFRPYTQISRSICTSESLRASTRVSPGFALFRHSSPSFGSQHARSHSNLAPEETWSVDVAGNNDATFHLRSLSLRTWVSATPVLAPMLDSLVRVSRRGEEKHFVRVGRDHGRSKRRYSPTRPRAHGPPYPAARIPRAPPGPGNSGAQPEPRRATGERFDRQTLLSLASLPAISGTL